MICDTAAKPKSNSENQQLFAQAIRLKNQIKRELHNKAFNICSDDKTASEHWRWIKTNSE